MGLGAFPGNHPLWLGMPGMHGTVAANRAIHHADVILAIGLRFDDRVTGKVSRFAPHAHTIIHVDIDPAEIGKVVRTHIPIVGDLRLVLKELLKGAKALRLAAWWREAEEWRTRYPLRYRPKPHLQSQEVIRAFYEATGGHAIVTTGVGQHQMFAAQFFPVTRPRSFLTSGGLGTMGVGLPFAIGAKIARPEELVIDFDGDGSFQMTLQELATVVKYKLDVKVVILNNGYLGMVRQWQDLFHAKRYSEVYLADSNPDFARLAEAYGIKGVRVERKEDLMKGVEAVLNADGPVVAEFKVYQEEGVFPMIPAGGAAEDMILEPRGEGGGGGVRHVISVLVQDHPRVLNRITGLFARRGFNLESLAVGTTHQPGLSRICLVVSGDDRTLEQVEKQLNRLIEVLKVTDHTEPHVERELCLVKVHVAGPRSASPSRTSRRLSGRGWWTWPRRASSWSSPGTPRRSTPLLRP